MMGTQPSARQPAFFSYYVDLERRLPTDHLLRRLSAALDLAFVLPAVRHCYGRSGNTSEDPRVIIKMLLLLFLYDIGSERELMEQIKVRLDFLWFLGFDLDTAVPDHSILSKARARWGTQVFEQLFLQTVTQCVAAGLVNGRLLHVDSTLVKANAHKDSVVPSGPELVDALRQAYQAQEAKLQLLASEPKATATAEPATSTPQAPAASTPAAAPMTALTAAPAPSAALESKPEAPTGPDGLLAPPDVQAVAETNAAPAAVATTQSNPATENRPTAPSCAVHLLPPPDAQALAEANKNAPDKKPTGKKLPANRTHISTTDPEAELARSKNGLTELNYKHHRIVDDAYGVITAVADTAANVPDGAQLAPLYEQHLANSGLKLAQVTVAGDGHYGTANNYIYCAQEGLVPHLREVSANLEERGKLPLSQFVYEPAQDRLRCPQGHYLVLHQDRPEEQAKVYLIENPAACAPCALREQCTKSQRGRSIQRHVQAEVVAAGRAEANSAAARHNRKRRQHVMEGSFADAVNNHGAKKARWRGLWRQQIQSALIATVQNLRILLRCQAGGAGRAAGAVLAGLGQSAWIAAVGGLIERFSGLGHGHCALVAHFRQARFEPLIGAVMGAITRSVRVRRKRPLGQHALCVGCYEGLRSWRRFWGFVNATHISILDLGVALE